MCEQTEAQERSSSSSVHAKETAWFTEKGSSQRNAKSRKEFKVT